MLERLCYAQGACIVIKTKSIFIHTFDVSVMRENSEGKTEFIRFIFTGDGHSIRSKVDDKLPGWSHCWYTAQDTGRSGRLYPR